MTTTTTTATTERPKARTSLGVWRLIPLGFVVVSGVMEAALALGWVVFPSTMPTFSLFFSDFTHMKVWLASAALTMAVLQLLWAARMYGLLRFPPGGGFFRVLHRWSGRAALLMTLPIAYHCILIVGQTPLDARVLAHMVIGAFFYGIVTTKLLIVRRAGLAGWLTPVAGGALVVALLGLWLTSVPWFVSSYGLSL